MRTLLLTMLFATGCTFNFQINTDYASQAGGAGTITEAADSESTATNSPTVETSIDPEGL
ncbi:hypothetical protein VAITEPHAGE_54 [Vibrio phage Vaitephage]|nr:hypothetical protein VAITEPHAGE_54 [Vibrio phage Vaitephage]